MKVLLTGANGQLGIDVASVFEATGTHEVVGLGHADLDVSNRESVLACVTTVEPDAIIHCAAWTAVDACESDEAKAYAVNAMGSRNIAEAAARVNAHLCALSTDYVFDGTKLGAYSEWDTPNPQSVYGRSKLAGEREVQSFVSNRGDASVAASIVRTSWVCGPHGSNMVKTVLRAAADPDRKLAFVDDQRGCPTFTSDLADALYKLVVGRIPGLFHVTNSGPVSWFEFAQAIVRESGGDVSRIRAISSAELDPPRPAPRPMNSVLDHQAWRLVGFEELPHWERSLVHTIKTLA